MFPQAADSVGFQQWADKGISLFSQLFHSATHTLKTFPELGEEFGIPQSHVFYFLQVTQHWKLLCLTLPTYWKIHLWIRCFRKGRTVYPKFVRSYLLPEMTQKTTPSRPTGPKTSLFPNWSLVYCKVKILWGVWCAARHGEKHEYFTGHIHRSLVWETRLRKGNQDHFAPNVVSLVPPWNTVFGTVLKLNGYGKHSPATCRQ